MTQRVIVTVIALPIIIVLVLFTPAVVTGILVGAAAARCAWEFLFCVRKDAPLRVSVYAAVSAFCIPFFSSVMDPGTAAVLCFFLLSAVMFCELMLSFRQEQKRKDTVDPETAALTVLGGAVFPLLLAGLVRLHNRADDGGVYTMLVFVIVFSNDIFSYLIGTAVGRHKIVPRLSPQKSLEGCVGGMIVSILLTLLYGVILEGVGYEVRQTVLAAYAFLGALSAQLGDLSFSAVKRVYGIKDFSRLIPGHGGMLDRFDSMIWTATLIELLTAWVPAIAKIAE